MNIVQLTPGAGGMFCGSCLRDNALVRELRRMGHDVLLVPLYLPLKTDEPDSSAGTPVFFGGINVFLQQKTAVFRKLPHALDRMLDAPALLNWLAPLAAKTRPEELGELTVSMLRGEQGRQNKELARLMAWLREHAQPDAIVLSNALLTGLARTLRRETGAPVVVTLHGEDSFLDSLPDPYREQAWTILRERAQEVDAFLSVSEYYAGVMRGRLAVPADRVRVVYNGIALDGFSPATPLQPPVLGYFARLCPIKGLDTLVDAYRILRKRGKVPGLRLRAGGTMTPPDEAYVAKLKAELAAEGLADSVEFHPNLDLEKKRAFFAGLSVFSVPAVYGESFGLYLLEALACGVPVVQPRHGAFPELLEATGGGILCKPGDPESLAQALEGLLLDTEKARRLGEQGRQRVIECFGVERMARDALAVYSSLAKPVPGSSGAILQSSRPKSQDLRAKT